MSCGSGRDDIHRVPRHVRTHVEVNGVAIGGAGGIGDVQDVGIQKAGLVNVDDVVICSAIGAHSVNKEDRSGANAGGCNLHGIAFKVGAHVNLESVAGMSRVGIRYDKEVAC